ncbi:MAG: D-alanine--D-alanine ligase family protein [Corynebacterium sp.]|uniref:D-alanine--D-alanine ligase family protein n=1 Tax=Corynebacterium sp. TaxID=1720 RepID=UPI0026E07B46|nr:D-alanine--D-alanine ligase family protein [Corynebacterium sp.]MDO5668985.1 D-alanine--D-alanine ligase family protein [Corynebacterium sp.]
MEQRITVGVIYGGRSTEHEISCVSAGAVMSHLDPEKYQVIPIGITKDGMWTVGESDYSRLQIRDGELPGVEKREELALSLDPADNGLILNLDSGQPHMRIDVAFPVLHGPFGEDGTIQGMLELIGLPYVGAGVLASACGMDKEFTKKLAAAEGLPITAELILRGAETDIPEVEKQRLGLPVFVKPARGGSSIGVSRVTEWEQLPAAIASARESDDKVIIEAEIIGDEVEVGVLEYPDGSLVASVPAKLNGTGDSEEGFYGFETKYLDDVVSPTIPAPYAEDVNDSLRALAVETFRALNCQGLSRVDFFLTADGPVLNEINTMPGFTPISMYPQVFAASGVAYEELLDVLVATALESARR